MTARISTYILVSVLATGALITSGCAGKKEDASAAPVQPGESVDSAVARVQSDSSKTPEQKVTEIDSIQQRYSTGQTPHKHKKSL